MIQNQAKNFPLYLLGASLICLIAIIPKRIAKKYGKNKKEKKPKIKLATAKGLTFLTITDNHL